MELLRPFVGDRCRKLTRARRIRGGDHGQLPAELRGARIGKEESRSILGYPESAGAQPDDQRIEHPVSLPGEENCSSGIRDQPVILQSEAREMSAPFR